MAKLRPVKLGTKLHRLQQEIDDLVNDPEHQFIALNCGRQAGKSVYLQHKALQALFNQERVMWVSKTMTAARSHWNSLLKAVRDVPNISVNKTMKEIVYGAGEMRVRSSEEPDNLRGESLNLIVLDEAAHYVNGEYTFWSVIMPMVTASRGKIIFATTPFGQNWFYNIYRMGNDEKQPRFVSRTYTSYDSPYQDRELLDMIKEKMPSVQWRTEYLAEFVANVSGVFSGVEEASCVEAEDRPTPGVNYVAGVDVGHTNDSTCITILDCATGRQVAGYRYSEMGTIEPIRRIIKCLDLWQPSVTAVETNGLGATFYAALRETLSNDIVDYEMQRIFGSEKDEQAGRHRLRGIHVDNVSKSRMVHDLAAAIEYGRLKILSRESGQYGGIQADEIATYERTMNPQSSNIRYGAMEGCHDDTVAALYLAYSCVPQARLRPKTKTEGKRRRNPFANSMGKSLSAKSY